MESYLRTTALASGQARPGGCRLSSLLWALLLVFAPAQLPAEITLYVGKHFEVREHDAPVKYVFNGSTRVARVTGSLSANERIQRLRLRAGWNLVSLAVTAPDFLVQLQQFTSGPAPVIQALYRWQPATKDHGTIASGESVPAGTVLWLSAQADAVVAVRGDYVEPIQWGVPGGDTFVAVPALETQPLQVPAGVTVWRYDALNRRWQAGLTGDLSSVGDLPTTLAPGDAIYVHANEPADLGAPAPEERILYYHQDHLGSSSAVTDASGALVEEAAFYPFGIPRHEHRLRQVEEPYKFTQKERDRESGFHYFEARYLAGGMSRFLSVDPKYANTDASAGDPQAMNLYSYVRNNPLKYTDPTGLEPVPDLSEIAHAAAVSDTRAAEKSGPASFSAGVGDAILDMFTPNPYIYEGLLGGTRLGPDIRAGLGINNVDTDSGAYGGGEIVGTLLTFATGAGEIRSAVRGGSTAAKALSTSSSVVDPLASTMATGAGSVSGAGGAASVRSASMSGIIRGGAARTGGGEVAGGGGVFARTGEHAALAQTQATSGTTAALSNARAMQEWYRGMVDATRAGREAMWRHQTWAQRADSLSVIERFAHTLFFGPK